jgi:hypothetical protein
MCLRQQISRPNPHYFKVDAPSTATPVSDNVFVPQLNEREEDEDGEGNDSPRSNQEGRTNRKKSEKAGRNGDEEDVGEVDEARCQRLESVSQTD